MNTAEDLVERTTKSIANKDEISQRMETFETNMLIRGKDLCLSTVQDEYGMSLFNNPIISSKKLIGNKFEFASGADEEEEEENEGDEGRDTSLYEARLQARVRGSSKMKWFPARGSNSPIHGGDLTLNSQLPLKRPSTNNDM